MRLSLAIDDTSCEQRALWKTRFLIWLRLMGVLEVRRWKTGKGAGVETVDRIVLLDLLIVVLRCN